MEVQPENELESRIVGDAEWQEGAAWGMPREGHPEGKVIFHIEQVLENVEKHASNQEERSKLRIIALIHDTFKYKVDISKPRVVDNNHAVIARKFAEKYLSDPTLLNIIELHDEAFNAWRKGNETNKWDVAEKRLRKLCDWLGPSLPLYYKFYRCDNETEDKDQACFRWFGEMIAKWGISVSILI